MKQKKLYLLLVVILLVISVAGCAQWDDSIVGKWDYKVEGADDVRYWEFFEDGHVEVVFDTGNKNIFKYLIDGEKLAVFAEDKNIEVEPPFYDYVIDGRVIYDVEGDKMMEKRRF